MSSRKFQGNGSPSRYSSFIRRFRRTAIKALFISSVSISVLVLASPAAAQIKQNLEAAGRAVARSSSLTEDEPAPLMFIPNQGQFDSSIKFELEASGGSAVFTDNSILIAVEKPGTNPPWVAEGGESNGASPTPAPPLHSEEDPPESDYSVVEIQFGGVNAAPQIDGENLLPTKISYFLGNDPAASRTDVPAFGKIRYDDFAPGYDLEIDGSSGAWEWRLVASSDSTAWMESNEYLEGYASMQAEGEEELPDLTLEVEGGEVGLEDGNIVIETDAGSITLPLIEVPQDTQPDEPSVSGDVVDSPFVEEGDAEPAAPAPASRYGSSGQGLRGILLLDIDGFVWIAGEAGEFVAAAK